MDTPQHAALAGVLEYACDEPVPPGTLVRVPLGRREVPGVVWSQGVEAAADESRLRPLQAVHGALPPLAPAWCRLVEFTAGYYQRSVGEHPH